MIFQIVDLQKTKMANEVQVIIHKTEEDQDRKHDIVCIAAEVTEEKDKVAEAEKDATGTGVTKDADIEVTVGAEPSTQRIEVGAERES